MNAFVILSEAKDSQPECEYQSLRITLAGSLDRFAVGMTALADRTT